ncbi:hypothetical protein Mal48_10120 [Thalassoglobus polymorphus]|uniref:Uncharacterized protein n=1 Tax=Thalassoglobus polymorphus TaxID=2527994 RepID=A0A517QJG7_9PLAN|nr:hypothetical protein Mal48_10120 [Thalassoglobus polymorphus]
MTIVARATQRGSKFVDKKTVRRSRYFQLLTDAFELTGNVRRPNANTISFIALAGHVKYPANAFSVLLF